MQSTGADTKVGASALAGRPKATVGDGDGGGDGDSAGASNAEGDADEENDAADDDPFAGLGKGLSPQHFLAALRRPYGSAGGTDGGNEAKGGGGGEEQKSEIALPRPAVVALLHVTRCT